MSLSNRVASYSFAIRSIVDYFETDEEAPPIEHCFDDVKQAQHYRFLFYGYRKALHRENNPSAAVADMILVRIPNDWKENKVARVVFSFRDNQETDKALEATLMKAMEESRKRRGETLNRPTTAPAQSEQPTEPSHDDVINSFLNK